MGKRGWRLAAELHGEASSRSTVHHGAAEAPSALASLLLGLWAEGTLSARMIQKVAHAALLDGCQHAEVATLASCGNFGDQQGNIHRDVMNQFLPQVHINEPCIIKTKCRDNKTSQVQEVEAATLMPHELLHALSKYEAVSSFFDSNRLVEFWSEVERSGCPKLKGHPVHSIPGWKQKCIPIFVH